MTERAPEPYAPQGAHEPRDPNREEVRVNNLLGLALFGVFVALFVGTVLVGLLYLAFD
ncbi:MAG: hypothetical protein H0V11_03195 [Actinobacteria bacterium]|nr:hypothetical protein [Actinomycetota bacterium]